MADIERMADEIHKSVEMYVDKRIAKLTTLMESILKRLDAQPTSAPTESFERRLSRHADHLASLETRMKKLER